MALPGALSAPRPANIAVRPEKARHFDALAQLVGIEALATTPAQLVALARLVGTDAPGA